MADSTITGLPAASSMAASDPLAADVAPGPITSKVTPDIVVQAGLPNQSGQSGNNLQSNGTTANWVAPHVLTIGDPITGSTSTRVLFVDGSNELAGDANFTFSSSTLTVGVSGTSLAVLGNGSAAGTFTNTTGTVAVATGGGQGITASNGSASVYIVDSADAIRVLSGNINIPGTSGNTIYWASATGAPTTQTLGMLPMDVFGAGTINQLLGTPDTWVLISIGGTLYKLPAYLA